MRNTIQAVLTLSLVLLAAPSADAQLRAGGGTEALDQGGLLLTASTF